MEIKEGLFKHVRADKVQYEERRYIHARELGVGRDEVLKRCSRTRHPSSSPVVGVGRVWVSAPLAPWYRTLVAAGVVRHQFSSFERKLFPYFLCSHGIKSLHAPMGSFLFVPLFLFRQQ